MQAQTQSQVKLGIHPSQAESKKKYQEAKLGTWEIGRIVACRNRHTGQGDDVVT